jgi:hypothetical protein
MELTPHSVRSHPGPLCSQASIQPTRGNMPWLSFTPVVIDLLHLVEGTSSSFEHECNNVAEVIDLIWRRGPPSSLEGLRRTCQVLHWHLEANSHKLHLALSSYRQTVNMVSTIQSRINQMEIHGATDEGVADDNEGKEADDKDADGEGHNEGEGDSDEEDEEEGDDQSGSGSEAGDSDEV